MYLNCHSFFSLNYGVMPVKEMIPYAKANGITRMALTDINNTSGVLEFLRLCSKENIQPSVGVDFRNGVKQLYVAIAKNNQGFKEICDYLTIYRQNKKEIPEDAPCFSHVVVIYPWSKELKRDLRDDEYIGIHPRDIGRYRLYGRYPKDKSVLLATLSFRGDKRDFGTHRLLRAIGENTLLSKLPKDQQGRPTDILVTETQLSAIREEMPELIINAEAILAQCHVEFEFNVSKNKRLFTNSEEEDKQLLIKLATDGLAYRYPTPEPKVQVRFDSELKTIFELGFTAYFLINWDIIRFGREQGFFYIGRGSGANSIIAYCLRITDVDPIDLELYFERFINAARHKSPPDFDIDFSHTDRDAVRSYTFDKYKGHVALVGSYSVFDFKSSTREIGRVLGLPDDEIDALQSDRLDITTLDGYSKLVRDYVERFKDIPNLLSVHACGILISEEPITQYTALELMPVGYPSTQFSMLEAEDVGLYKFDILSQRGLGHIKDAVGLVKKNKGIDIDIHRIQDFKTDVRMNQMLKRGDTIGCFYIESPAMRQLLRKLEADDYLSLVAASSIIRPGVSHSGMMREFILRYRDPERAKKMGHPELLKIMPDTFGVMVYQEDVIKVAHYYAGLTLAEADIMRRGMSGKFRSREEFQQVRIKYFSNCHDKGYPPEEAAEVWRQIESFAGYSFAKGHSASYAVESYQSLFLRTYYPIEFITGVLNNFGGYYSTEFYLQEARMLGAQIELPCINTSTDLAVLVDRSIYMGFSLIKDLEHASIASILHERENGLFVSLTDFVRRVPISLEQLRILIRIKAFRFTGRTSKELLWDAHLALGKTKKTAPKKELFPTPDEPSELPPLEYGEYEDALDEMKILSFPYSSPFTLLKREYPGMVYARDLHSQIGNVVYMTGYYIMGRRVTTVNGDMMYFGNFFDKNGDLFDTVHFPKSIAAYPFSGKGCYLVKGTVVEDFGVPSVEVSHLKRLPWAFADAALEM